MSESARLAATAIIAWFAWANAGAQTPNASPQEPAEQPVRKGLLADIEAYYTAPLRWDATDWTYFAGMLAAVGVAHHFDSDVRTHFTSGSSNALASGDPNDLKDAVPAIAALAGTWLYATVSEDRDARTVAWAMTEAAGLSLTSGVVLRYATGRERPNETTDPNLWWHGGSSFPSLHATAAFAVGTVFAESGEGGYRWLTRLLGYGLAGFTGYERLKHNQHWLSDVVAGSALGASTGLFVMERTYRTDVFSHFNVVPIERGIMITYATSMPR